MTALVMALYAEGRTDERFLPLIIQRTATQILAQRSVRVVDVLEPLCISPQQGRARAERILQVARQTRGYHCLIVHGDADAATQTAAIEERFMPGAHQVQLAQQQGEEVCPALLPIVPVYMTEAWMLADTETLCGIIGTTMPHHALNLPANPQHVESIADPKKYLAEVMQAALASRTRRYRRRRSIRELYEPLAQQIQLERLSHVSAYRQFVQALTETLVQLNFIA